MLVAPRPAAYICSGVALALNNAEMPTTEFTK